MRINKLKNKELTTVILLPIFAAASILIVCFSAYIARDHKILISVAIGAIALAAIMLLFFGCVKTFKLMFIGYTVLTTLAVVFLVLEKTGFMDIFNIPNDCGDRNQCISDNLKNYLQQTGQWSTLMYIGLQFFQTIALPIPSIILTGAGNMMYSGAYGEALGPLINSCYSLIGIIGGSIIAFFLGRRYGLKLVVWIVGYDNVKKILKMISGRDILILTLMFILPFFPDDTLCFVAGLSSMSAWYFVIVIAISKIMVVFGSSYLLNFLPFTTWWGILCWTVMLALGVCIFYIFIKNGDKIMQWLKAKFPFISKIQRGDTGQFSEMEREIDKMEQAENVENLKSSN